MFFNVEEMYVLFTTFGELCGWCGTSLLKPPLLLNIQNCNVGLLHHHHLNMKLFAVECLIEDGMLRLGTFE